MNKHITTMYERLKLEIEHNDVLSSTEKAEDLALFEFLYNEIANA